MRKILIETIETKKREVCLSGCTERFFGYSADIYFKEITYFYDDCPSAFEQQDTTISYGGQIVIQIWAPVSDDSSTTYADSEVVNRFKAAGFSIMNNDETHFCYQLGSETEKDAFLCAQNILQKHGIFITEIKSIKKLSNFSNISLPSE